MTKESATQSPGSGRVRSRSQRGTARSEQVQASFHHLQVETDSLRDQLARSCEENEHLRASAMLWIGLYERQLARANALASAVTMPVGVSATHGDTVLLVQADRDNREMYAELLLRSGFRPIVTADARVALRAAGKADAIVTGILLGGGMDGLEMVRRLKRDTRTRDIPVIVLTSCSWPSERLRAERAGCALFFAKPCLPDELLDGLRRVLGGTPDRAV